MPNCQLEYVSSHSDDGRLCGKPAIAECADWVQRFVQTVDWTVAAIRSAVNVTTITVGIPACVSLFKAKASPFQAAVSGLSPGQASKTTESWLWCNCRQLRRLSLTWPISRT
jgi:hypothetical protein